MHVSLRTITRITLIISLFITLLLRLHLTLFRYFDTDEFAHLNWAYHLFIGQLPFKDYFIHFVPLYHWIMFPVFMLPQSPNALLFGRIMMYIAFIATAVLVGLIARHIIKRKETFLLTLLIISIIPLMIDKSIEIRPDMVMMFFYVLAVYIVMTKKLTAVFMFLTGIIISLSLMVFPKILIGIPALLFLVVYPYIKILFKEKNYVHPPWKAWGFFLLGGFLPFLFFLLYLLLNGILFLGISTILQTTTDIYAEGIARFSPFQTLAPWPYVYVKQEGPSIPWALNIFLLLTMIGGVLLLALDKKWKIVCFYTIFFLCSVLYLLMFPTPYVQYFIPIMLIGAPASTYFFLTIYQFIKNPLGKIIFMGSICFVFLLSYGIQYQARINSDNSGAEQMQVIRDVVAHVKPEETMYDMAGSYVFRPSGYYICCYRYANFIHLLKPTPGPLTQSLIDHQTKFIVLDRNGYAFWMVPEPDKTFVRTNYLESAYKKIYSVGYRYSCNNGNCVRINYEGGTIEQEPGNILPIVIEETYKLHTNPQGLSVTIDGNPMNDQETRLFQPGRYQLGIPQDMKEFKIQIDR